MRVIRIQTPESPQGVKRLRNKENQIRRKRDMKRKILDIIRQEFEREIKKSSRFYLIHGGLLFCDNSEDHVKK